MVVGVVVLVAQRVVKVVPMVRRVLKVVLEQSGVMTHADTRVN